MLILLNRLNIGIFLLIFFIYYLVSAHKINNFEENNGLNIINKVLNTSLLFNSSEQ